jgi:hypothetical protein
MKYFILLIFLLTSCTSTNNEYTKVSGNLKYTKDRTEKASNNIGLSFKKPIHETKDKKLLYYLGGNIYHNYDLFNNSYHINGFGNLGIEF